MNNIQLIAVSLGGVITNKMGLDPSLSGMVSSIFMVLTQNIEEINYYYLLPLCIICLIYYNYDKIPWRKRHVSSLLLSNRSDPEIIIKYMELNKEYFGQAYSLYRGDLNFKLMINKGLTGGQIVYFDDKKFNVEGDISIQIKTVDEAFNKEKVPREYSLPTISVYENDAKITASQYFDLIVKDINHINSTSQNIHTEYCKIFSREEGDSNEAGIKLYSGPRNDLSHNMDKYMKYFFHRNKESIMDDVRMVMDENLFDDLSSVRSLNMILYGPPGTGKSDFIRRVALITNKSISSINVSSYKKKEELYYSFCDESPENIIVFEEFDSDIKKILERERENKEAAKIKNKKCNDYEVRVKDLLELLQGFPINGQIVIATTNDLDFIREACPALVRHGRLTPIEFDYLKRKEVNEMLKAYFPDEDLSVKFDPNIITSELIDVAVRAKFKKDSSILMEFINNY